MERVIEPGGFTALIGRHSADTPLEAKFSVR
jgi:hypothetical protein